MKKTSLKKISYDNVWELKKLSEARGLTIDQIIRYLLQLEKITAEKPNKAK